MRKFSVVLCLAILAVSTGPAAAETTVIDPAAATGIRVEVEIDPIDPAWARCAVEWLRATDEAQIRVVGPASVSAGGVPATPVTDSEGWASGLFAVSAGARHELILHIGDSQPVVVLAERAEAEATLLASSLPSSRGYSSFSMSEQEGPGTTTVAPASTDFTRVATLRSALRRAESRSPVSV